MQKLKFSVMGDSISTYEDFNPFFYAVYYDEAHARLAGMDSVDDTWWMRVIDFFGGELCANSSFSGSCVAGETDASAHSYERIENLKNGDDIPDVIIVMMGANDCWENDVKPEGDKDDRYAFDAMYSLMLERIREKFPKAKICCATVMLTDAEASGKFPLHTVQVETYNKVIRKVCALHGCILVEMGSGYTTADGTHPDKNGHKIMAEQMIKELRPYIRKEENG